MLKLKASEAARDALESVLDAVAGESVVIVCDDVKNEVDQAFADGVAFWSLGVRHGHWRHRTAEDSS